MRNRLFFPQAAIDQWGIDGKVDLSASELILTGPGRTYKVVEAVRIVTEVTGANDEHMLVGKVKAKSDLEKLGAEILEGSMIIGDNAYDVVQGWAAEPASSFAEYMAHAALKGVTTPATEEELLRSFVGG